MGHFTNEYSISYGNDLIINYNYLLFNGATSDCGRA